MSKTWTPSSRRRWPRAPVSSSPSWISSTATVPASSKIPSGISGGSPRTRRTSRPKRCTRVCRRCLPRHTDGQWREREIQNGVTHGRDACPQDLRQPGRPRSREVESLLLRPRLLVQSKVHRRECGLHDRRRRSVRHAPEPAILQELHEAKRLRHEPVHRGTPCVLVPESDGSRRAREEGHRGRRSTRHGAAGPWVHVRVELLRSRRTSLGTLLDGSQGRVASLPFRGMVLQTARTLHADGDGYGTLNELSVNRQSVVDTSELLRELRIDR